MNVQNLSRDQFAKFIFSQSEKIKSYHFDLCHDIAKIVNFAYDSNNYRDDRGQIITDKAVVKSYFFYVRESGTHLIDIDSDMIETIERVFTHINKYQIDITPNCDYLFGTDFAKVTQII